MYPNPFPPNLKGDVQIFTNPSTVTAVQLHVWNKPRGCTFVSILCIGGGGGGGGGFTRAALGNGAGGGGGGSSACTRVFIPAYLLPDRLYIQVGAGGQGAASGGGTAGSGVLSYVTIHPAATITATNVIAVSGNAAATGGVTGTASGTPGAGSAGSAATIANMPLAGLGFYQLIAGNIGASGAAPNITGVDKVFPTTSVLTTGGAGGAGVTSTDRAGGGWTAVTDSFLSEIRPATPAAGSVDGGAGFTNWQPFFSFGGTGGSSSDAGIGGNGGNGGYGSGGGGGGAGTTGGRGGDGGSGIVIITAT